MVSVSERRLRLFLVVHRRVCAFFTIPTTHRPKKPGVGGTDEGDDQCLRFVISSVQDSKIHAIIGICQGSADGIKIGAGTCGGKTIAVWELQSTTKAQSV